MNEPKSSQSSKAGIVCSGLGEALGARLRFDATWLESSIVATDFLLRQTFFASVRRSIAHCLKCCLLEGLLVYLNPRSHEAHGQNSNLFPEPICFGESINHCDSRGKRNIKKRGSLVRCHWNGEDSTHKPSFRIFSNMNWLLSPVSGEPLEITSVFALTHRVPKERN